MPVPRNNLNLVSPNEGDTIAKMEKTYTEYLPAKHLRKYVDAYWSSCSEVTKPIQLPVMPDGCSDIIFYRKNSDSISKMSDTFVTGIMDVAYWVEMSGYVSLFAIRFNPGVLSYLLKTEMFKLKNKNQLLKENNPEIYEKFLFDPEDQAQKIINDFNKVLTVLLTPDIFNDNLLEVIAYLNSHLDLSIKQLSEMFNYTPKALERAFNKRIGMPAKKFASIMRFFKTHKAMSKEGLSHLIKISLDSGYYDQAHFNREYKKLVGYNPSNEALSFLYNTKK